MSDYSVLFWPTMFTGSASCSHMNIGMPDYIATPEPMTFTVNCMDVPAAINYIFNVVITGYEPPLLWSFATPWNPYEYYPNTTFNASVATSFVPAIQTTGSPGNTTLFNPLVFPLGNSVHLITVVGTRVNKTYTWTVHRPYWKLQPTNLLFDGASASATLAYSTFATSTLAFFTDEFNQPVGNVTVTPTPTLHMLNANTGITLSRNGILVGRNASTSTLNFNLASCSPCVVTAPSVSITNLIDAAPWTLNGGTVALQFGLNMPWNLFRDVIQPIWQLNLTNTANDGVFNYTWDVNAATIQHYQGQVNQSWEMRVWDQDEQVPLICNPLNCLVNGKWTKSVQMVQIPVGFTLLTLQNAVFNASSGQWDAGNHTTGPVQVAASFGCDGMQGPANWTISTPGAVFLQWTCQNRWSGELVSVNATIVQSVSIPPAAPSPLASSPPLAPSIAPARPSSFSLNATTAGVAVSVAGSETSEDGQLQIIVTSNLYITLSTSFTRVLIRPNADNTQFIISGLPDQDPCTPDLPYDVFITSVAGNTSAAMFLGTFIHRNVVPVSISASPAVGSLLGRNISLTLQGIFNLTWNNMAFNSTWSCQPLVVAWTVPHSNNTGYANIILNPGPLQRAAPNVFFYTEDCPEEGQFGVGLDCRPCPTGGECPGGNRIIAKPGYWNRGETSGFVQKCDEPSTRCLGQGRCGVGYTGDFCAQCAPKFYNEGGACQPCGSSQIALITLVMVIILFFGALYTGVFFASNETLNGIVGTLTTIQLITASGNVPVINMPNWMHQYYRMMGLFSFDARVARPECSGISGFRGRVMIMLGYTFIAFFPIVILFFTRRQRTIRCAIIVGSIIYYAMTVVGFTGIACKNIHGTLYLSNDLTVRCARAWTTYICALIACASVVFPAWALHRAYLSLHIPESQKEVFHERYGFFYEEVRVFWYVPASLVLLFMDALTSAFAPNWLQSVFVIVFLGVFALYTAVRKPYHESFGNIIAIVGLGASIMLAIASLLVPKLSDAQILWLCVCTITISVGLLGFMIASTGWMIRRQKLHRKMQMQADLNFAKALAPTDPPLPHLLASARGTATSRSLSMETISQTF